MFLNTEILNFKHQQHMHQAHAAEKLSFQNQRGGCDHITEVPHFFPIPLTSTTFWRVLMAFSRTGSTDCMIPSLLSMSLIYGCMPSMAFIFLATSTRGCPSSSLLRILAVRDFWMFLMAAVLATAASPSPLASDSRADERVEDRFTRSSSSFMWSYLVAATAAMRVNFMG